MTGAGAGPDGPVDGPTRELEGEGPSADPGEEVTLGIRSEVIRAYLHDTAFIHITIGDKTSRDEVTEPLGGVWIELVVVIHHLLHKRGIRAPGYSDLQAESLATFGNHFAPVFTDILFAAIHFPDYCNPGVLDFEVGLAVRLGSVGIPGVSLA